MFETILAATDGSAEAEKALRVAGQLAGANGAHLIVTYVIEAGGGSREGLRRYAEIEHGRQGQSAPRIAPAVATAPGHVLLPETGQWAGGPDVDMAAAEESAAERLLQQAADIACEEGARNVSILLRRGDAGDRLVEAAAEHGAGAIVMGTRGLGGLKGAVLGSVSRKVSDRADCVCITVN